jgi:hypothetical protein
MLLFFRFTLFLSLLFFPPAGKLTAQILLGTSPLSRSTDFRGQPMGQQNPSGGGITLGGLPLIMDSQPNSGLGGSDSANYSLPPLLNGTRPGSSSPGININDFSVGEPTLNSPSYGVPLYGGSGGYGGDSGNSFQYHRKSREEIVRMKQEEAIRSEMIRQENETRLIREIEAKKGIQLGIKSLLGEIGNQLPQIYDTEISPNISSSENNRPQTQKTLQAMNAAGMPSSNRPLTPSPDTLATSPSASSAEEQPDSELKSKRSELEKMENSERKQQELLVLQRREETRKRILAQRAEIERGTTLFQPQLQLRNNLLDEGWCTLFDGKTFFGWRTQKEGPYSGGQFSIENGEIRSNPQHPGLLYTTNQFGDSTLSLEFQAEAASEVFLLLRTPPSPTDLFSSCYTVVLNSADQTRPRGTILGRYQVKPESLNNKKKISAKDFHSQWHTLNARFEKGHLQITIDQNELVTLLDTKPLSYGYIGLLVAKGNARFRNMIWLPSSMLPLSESFDPTTNWRYNGNALKVQATADFGLKMTGGPGMIETKESYNNFVLNLEYNLAFSSSRAGVFFRSIPREEQTGYEISLQNVPKREDRDQFVGVDAGSFRNKKNARFLRPEDQKWNHLTLVCIDRQFQTWLNGVPVCEMSDFRLQETEDSKTGPFFLPGTIQLFVPKEGSSVLFRNIRIQSIPPRQDKPRTFEDTKKTTWEELSKARRVRQQEPLLNKEKPEQKKK